MKQKCYVKINIAAKRIILRNIFIILDSQVSCIKFKSVKSADNVDENLLWIMDSSYQKRLVSLKGPKLPSRSGSRHLSNMLITRIQNALSTDEVFD